MNITSHCQDCGHTWATDEWADCPMCGGLPEPDDEAVLGQHVGKRCSCRDCAPRCRFGWARFTIGGVSVVSPTVNGRLNVHVYGLTDDPRTR